MNEYFLPRIKGSSETSSIFLTLVFKLVLWLKNFCSPYLSSKTVLFPSILFFPRMTFYSQEILQKFCWQNFLPKRNCSSKTCSPKFPPKKIPFKKNLFPILLPNFHPKEFAPPFFPPKNLLPNILALYISSHNEILLIKIFLLAKFPPHKNLSSKTWSLKFPSKKICFKKKLFPILPPPPPAPKKKIHAKE